MHVTPKKYLGQHFLKDKNIARNIVNALSVPKEEGGDYHVIEIGCGTGVLTDYLLPLTKQFIACDVDHDSVEYLKKKYPQESHKFLRQDFLEMDIDHWPAGKIYLIGNLPYHISGPIFFRVAECHMKIVQAVFMVQKEVAERITAPEGNRIYGILSVLLQTFYRTEYLFTVSEQVFYPPPKVKSAVVRLTHKQEWPELDFGKFSYLVRQAFNQRRKQLNNALRMSFAGKTIPPEFQRRRAEELSPQDFIRLYYTLYEKEKGN